MAKTNFMNDYPLSDLTYKIIGICMEVHRQLGHGFLEAVYKEAIEIEATLNHIHAAREEEFTIQYKEAVLKHKYYADFLIEDTLILEVKCAEGAIADAHIAQTLNYLKVSDCKVGLIVNFGRKSLEYKRLIF